MSILDTYLVKYCTFLSNNKAVMFKVEHGGVRLTIEHILGSYGCYSSTGWCPTASLQLVGEFHSSRLIEMRSVSCCWLEKVPEFLSVKSLLVEEGKL